MAAAQMAAGPRKVTARDWIGFFAMVVGMFMAILDIQIVSSSLAEIQAGVSASADEISWVQTSYLIAEVIMIPLSGILARVLSTRWLFVISATGFTFMSLACALAWNIESLIVFRSLQGFLGGAMIPTVFATSFSLFPLEKRAGVSVMIGLVATMAPTLGPTLGGYLTQSLSWHWLFLINVAPGMLVTGLVWTFVKFDKADLSLLKGFDFPGLLFMALFLGTLEYVVEEGPRNDWLEDRAIATGAAVCAVSGIVFFARVLTYHNPIVGLRAFKDRNFAIGCLFSFVIGIGLYGSVYLMPLFLGQIRGLNSLQIGMVMFVTGIFQFASAPIAGIMSKKLDLRVMLGLGLGMFGTGIYLNSILTSQSDFWELFLPQAVRGFSLMMCFIPVNTLALGTLPPAQLKNASGLYNLMRNLGGAIGLATINTVLIERYALHMSRLSDNVATSRPGVQDMLDGIASRMGNIMTGDSDLVALKVVQRIVHREAMVLTFTDCLMLMAGVFAFALMLTPLVRKPRQTVQADH
jgi:DHA2 family multidrug resistance protein